MKRVAMVAVVCLLAGCQTTTQTTNATHVWARTDGQIITGNPALTAQFDLDRTICEGEMQKAAVGMEPIYYRGLLGALSAQVILDQRAAGLLAIAKGCMAQRGYVLVAKSSV